MRQISFGSDNHSGIHPEICKSLTTSNSGHVPAYGTDDETLAVNKLLRSVFGESCDPYYVFNGTAANVLGLQALVASYEAVVTTATAHLHLDECGAPEAHIGCKIITTPSADGKIDLKDVERLLVRRGDQHYAQPSALSITLPTEYGTCYSVDELRAIRRFTTAHGMYLHIDGARLIYAAHYLKLSLQELTEGLGVDAVSFGGTKNGLLFGEIVLLYHQKAKENFKYLRKQNMQLPSKTRFLAAQFGRFLDPARNLWSEIASHGHDLAKYLGQKLEAIPELTITQKIQANSVFVKIPQKWVKPLRENFFFYIWDESTFEARLMISFDLSKDDIDDFVQKIHMVKESHPI